MMLRKLVILMTLQITCFSVHSLEVEAPIRAQVLNHYSKIALSNYSDSLNSAKKLHASIRKLVNTPSDITLEAAKNEWLNARKFYQQTEIFRFGNAIVDEWEGRVNAWPLDEGLIDYVDGGYGVSSDDNPMFAANVIGSTQLTVSGGKVDISKIDEKLLTEVLHEADGVEANVAIGYHAIEFLLWGQDLNGTGKGAGKRPPTDYSNTKCTHENCDRRSTYLLEVSSLLVRDLSWMVDQWQHDGAARKALLGDHAKGIASILTGLGSLSYGELAGERIKLGLLLNDPEEEHDCFSDNTHNSHYYNIQGIQNIYLGKYTQANGEQLNGRSVADLVKDKDLKLHQALEAQIAKSLAAAQAVVDSAEEHGVAYDQLLAKGNAIGNAKLETVVDALLDQTVSIQSAMNLLGYNDIEIEGSDSLDNSQAIFE